MYKQKVAHRKWNLNATRELNAKQACMPAFIVSNKACIVTIIASDINGVIILIDISLFIQRAFLNLYTRLWLTHTKL